MKDYSYISKKYFNYTIEKRQHKRVVLIGRIKAYKLNGDNKKGRIELFNLSVGGLGFKSVDEFAVGDVLEFVIDIPKYISMQIMCNIVWRGLSDNGYIYGSQFVCINNLNRDMIKSYIDGMLTSER